MMNNRIQIKFCGPFSKKVLTPILLLLMISLLPGCGWLVKSATGPIIDNLTMSVMKQKDLDTVKDGAPAFLLMIDGMVESSPDDPDTLMAAANLYSAYNSAFVADQNPARAKLMAEKAKDYAFKAMSLRNDGFADTYDKAFSKFEPVVLTFEEDDVEIMFLVITTWAAYIQANSYNMDNLADIAKIEALANRLLVLDENYYFGSGHLVMAVLKTLLPAALGGKPEVAKVHFEKAIEISKGKFLPAYVMYAQKYARMKFDRELHDRLLKTVINTPVDIVPELTLINAIAQKQARALLADADEYF